MSETHPRPRNPRKPGNPRKPRGRAWACAAAAFALAGCRSPLAAPPPVDPGLRERLQAVDPVRLSDYAAPAGTPGGASGGGATEEAAPGPPPEPPREREVSLEQARAWALRDNLDLAAALVDPAAADAEAGVEEARFEAVLFGSGAFDTRERPVATQLQGNDTENLDGRLGVRVPLRTGGLVEVDYGTNRFETDNQFATLNPSFSAGLGVSISQPLLRGGGVWANVAPIRVAQLNAQAVSARTRLEVIRVVAEVDRTYWSLYEARRQLEVREQQHELALGQLARARRLVAAGELAQTEILRAQAGVADGLEAIIAAEQTLRVRERTLKRLLNQEGLPIDGPTALVPATPPDPAAPDLDPARVLAAALGGRAELLELELNVAAESLRVGLARNGLLPLATVDYRYNQDGLGTGFGDAGRDAFDGDASGHRVGLRVEVPLGNQAAESRYRAAVLARLQRLSTRAQRERQITQEVYDALDALATSWQRLLAARQSALLEARVVEAERRQFELGLRTGTEVLEAQAALADARSREASALARHQIARVDVAFATGTVLGHARIRWEPRDPTGGQTQTLDVLLGDR